MWASGDEGLESPGLCASVASHDSTIAQSKVRPFVTRPHKHKQERAPQSEREAATRGEHEQAAAPDGTPVAGSSVITWPNAYVRAGKS